MILDSIKLIGNKQHPRKDSHLASLKEVDGLISTFQNDFNVWSNFDKWENIIFQRWVFERALEVYKGKKIDLKCPTNLILFKRLKAGNKVIHQFYH